MPLRIAWEQAPDEPEAAVAWVVVLALVGEVPEARRQLATALQTWPKSQSLINIAAALK